MMKNIQRGAALITALIFLLVMTLVALSAMESTIFQERMVGAHRDATIAREGAERALTVAEQYIDNLSTLAGFGSTVGLYSLGNAPSALAPSTWENLAMQMSTIPTGLSEAPKFFIEQIGVASESNDAGDADLGASASYGAGGGGDLEGFRIVARSTGASGLAESIIESYYTKRF